MPDDVALTAVRSTPRYSETFLQKIPDPRTVTLSVTH